MAVRGDMGINLREEQLAGNEAAGGHKRLKSGSQSRVETGREPRTNQGGGFLQFSISHPCTNSPVRQWVTDDDGRRVAASGGYFEKALYRDTWLFGAAPPELRRGRRPFAIPRFPRTISGWLNAVVASGLVIEAAAEPFADERTAAEHPEVAGTRIAPYFLLFRARKQRH